jgi:hypothetical protein
VTAALEPPAGATLEAGFHAIGQQVYKCTAATGDAGTTYSWVLDHPDAKLYDATCTQVATHSAGPTWTSTVDGSSVVGTKVASQPSSGTIAWLLLQATSNTGAGIFSNVTAIQRLDTTGGVAPTTGCDASHVDTLQGVDYTANYYFWTGGNWDAGTNG